MMLRYNHLRMDTVGDATGGTPGGGGTLLTPAATTPAAPAATTPAAPAATTPAAPAATTPATSWRTSLPAELQSEASLQTFNDVAALAKSYVHASKTLGSDKIVVPGKLATDDDWKSVFSKLGLPADIKEYQLKMDETASMDKEFIGKFKETAHAAGILPQQAQKLADWFQGVNKQSESEVLQLKTKKIADDVSALKSEWGAAYDKNLQIAGQVLREASDPETIKYLDESGLGNDTRLVKLLSNIGLKFLGEDKLLGGNKELSGQLDPKSAIKRANEMMANFDSPYHKKDHPNHKAAVQEVQDLMAMAYPTKK